MWMDSTFARWEVEGEAQERIKAAHREADLRRLAQQARGTGTVQVHARLLAAAQARLQRLTSRTQADLQPAQT